MSIITGGIISALFWTLSGLALVLYGAWQRRTGKLSERDDYVGVIILGIFYLFPGVAYWYLTYLRIVGLQTDWFIPLFQMAQWVPAAGTLILTLLAAFEKILILRIMRGWAHDEPRMDH